jgi:hypothetical protein
VLGGSESTVLQGEGRIRRWEGLSAEIVRPSYECAMERLNLPLIGTLLGTPLMPA